MMLCLDAGNSRLKYGLFGGGRWLVQGALKYSELGDLRERLPATPERLIVCNVAGAAIALQLEAWAGTLGLEPEWFLSSDSSCGVTNGYALPTQLGADRWAALIGARGIHTGNALVVMSGTATTIDVLDAAGNFSGGVILPGLSLMRRALASGTAGLPLANGSFVVFPSNTSDAIESGAVQATLGAIERIAGDAFAGAKDADNLCLVSGGAADVLAPHLQVRCRVVPNLVLEGLLRFGQR
jgi:type III pantothenate kinase